MAFGDNPCDDPLRTAWQSFCRELAAAGDRVFKDYNPATPLHRADALRFLTQNLGQAFDLALETRDPHYPALHPFCTPTRKLGGDAADFVYHQAWLDGQTAYRIYGERGTARFINFTLQGARPDKQPGTDIPSLHDPFGDIPEANLFGHQLETNADGSFELFLGGPQRGPNWLPTTPDTRKLFLRQGFDRWDEVPARLNIENLDMTAPKPPPSPDTMIDAMQWAGKFVVALMDDWPDHPYHYSPFVDPVNVNCFPPEPKGGAGQDDQRRGRAVAHLCWELQDEDALVIEFDAHDNFWMLSNAGVFFNSLDYLYRPVSYTPSRTAVDSDGKIRIVLCHRDPGYHNWLDTQGLVRGNITWRNLLSTHATTFRTQVLSFAQLAAAMPGDAARVSQEERVAQMKTRFASIRRRYAA